MTKTRRWMNANWRDYVDDLDGQLSCTRMAEGAADFAENAVAEERHFEEAHELATQLERAGLVNPRCPSMHNAGLTGMERSGMSELKPLLCFTIKARDLEITPCDRKDVVGFIEQHHYSKSINGVKVTQCFRVDHEGRMVGAVLFGQLSTTAWKKFGNTEKEVLELRRLVLLDECGRNSESRVIGHCLRWVAKNLPDVRTVVSYADPMYGHKGTIYRASNFTMIGTTPDDKGYLDLTSGKTYHSRALRTKHKGEYKPFVKRLRHKLENGELVETILKGKYCYVYEVRQ